MFELLHKYDGQRVHDDIKAGRRRYRFLRLPRFLGMHMKRFTKNNFYVSTGALPTVLGLHGDSRARMDMPVPNARRQGRAIRSIL